MTLAKIQKSDKEFAKALVFAGGGALPAHMIVLGATSPIFPLVSLASLSICSMYLGRTFIEARKEHRNFYHTIKFNDFVNKGESND